MRRPAAIAALTVAVVLCAPGGGGAHPGHGEFARVDVGGFAFSPARVQVTAGEEVVWYWAGPDRQHTVTADDGSFDSHPGGIPGPTGRNADDPFGRVFSQAGEFGYHCKVHRDMRGVVVVDPPPPVDEAPRVESLRVPARVRTRLTVRFALSEPATVLLDVDRLRPAKRVLSRSHSLPAGPGRLVVGVRGLRPGRYRVQLVAVDEAGGIGLPADAGVRVVRAPKRARARTRR